MAARAQSVLTGVVKDDLRNVPTEAIYSWDPGAYFGMYHVDTFWFDTKPPKDALHPGGNGVTFDAGTQASANLLQVGVKTTNAGKSLLSLPRPYVTQEPMLGRPASWKPVWQKVTAGS